MSWIVVDWLTKQRNKVFEVTPKTALKIPAYRIAAGFRRPFSIDNLTGLWSCCCPCWSLTLATEKRTVSRGLLRVSPLEQSVRCFPSDIWKMLALCMLGGNTEGKNWPVASGNVALDPKFSRDILDSFCPGITFQVHEKIWLNIFPFSPVCQSKKANNKPRCQQERRWIGIITQLFLKRTKPFSTYFENVIRYMKWKIIL